MTKDQIIAEIQDWLSGDSVVNEEDLPARAALVNNAVAQFGSLGNAVRESGIAFCFSFGFVPVKMRTTRKAAAEVLLRWIRVHGPVSPDAIIATDLQVAKQVQDNFSSLERLVELLDVPVIPESDGIEVSVPIPTAMTDAPPEEEELSLIDQLKSYAGKSDKLTKAWLIEQDSGLVYQLTKEYGTWTNALKAAGLK